MSKRWRNITLTTLVNACRMLLAATFLFSGFVKANDPMGMVYKLEDYLAQWGISSIPQLVTLCIALALAFFEFGLGLYLLTGMRRRIVSAITLIFMAVMTLFTIYIAIYNPVSDCGCFGDAIVLTNTQTLLKNLLLLACASMVFKWYKLQQPLIGRQSAGIASTLLMLALATYAIYCVYTQPVIDFRPYKTGTDMHQLIDVPDDKRPQYEVTIIYEKDGETMELSIDDDDPDSTWNYVETRRKEIVGVDASNTNDFIITDSEGDDVTPAIIESNEYVMLLTAPTLQTADQSVMGRINELFDYAQENAMNFVALTISDDAARDKWAYYTGAEYDFYTCDDRVLKTMVRANPGLVLLHNGVIIGKWSNWNLPEAKEISEIITK